MAADYARAGYRWADEEYERVAALPVGASRETSSRAAAKKR
jgi:hypothetical protein